MVIADLFGELLSVIVCGSCYSTGFIQIRNPVLRNKGGTLQPTYHASGKYKCWPVLGGGLGEGYGIFRA